MVNRRRAAWLLTLMTILVFGVVFARWARWGQQIPRDQVLKPQIVVLAYDSFASVSGPGPKLVKEFEKYCRCQVQLMSAGDSGMLIEKLRLGKNNTPVDVVLGVDQLLLQAARTNQSWKKISNLEVKWEPEVQDWVEEEFIPFDWAPLTFIYRRGETEPPVKPMDLMNARFQQAIALQDPRTSSPGMQFLFALQHWLGDRQLKSFMPAFKANLHSVSPSWSMSYGLFQRRQAKMAFSYVTSLVYHWTVEKDLNYQAVRFEEGHPLQVEYAAIPAECTQCALAEEFIRHLLKPESQRLLMTSNFMFPAVAGVLEKSAFAQLPELPAVPRQAFEDFEKSRAGFLESWLHSLK